MEIKLHSFGTKDSLDFRNILEGMYRKAGVVTWVDFPDEHTIKLLFKGEYDYEDEYGVHRMVSLSKDNLKPFRRVSHVMVEINGRTRDNVVASYIFYPIPFAQNNRTNAQGDLMEVLNGNPLEMKMRLRSSVPVFA